MSCGYIYKIQFPNGKHYIGLTTTSLKQRKGGHKIYAKNGDKRFLYNALRKYNMVDTFELVEIDTADTLEELYEKEIRYIKEYNSYYMNRNGYNMTYGGEGISGYIFTEEDNRKNSERQKKYFEDNPEEREKNALRSRNYWDNNEEAKQQMSEIKRNYWDNNEEAKQQMSAIKKKYFEDNPEARQKQSEITTKYFEDNPQARQKQSEITTKYFEDNPEARQQISESLKKYYKEVPDAKQKNSEAQKKYYKDNPEARQQHSEIKKKYYENNPDARRKLSDRKGKNKPFDVFRADGTYIKTFAYQFEAKEYLQKEYHITTNISISAVLEGKQTKSAGFVFKYKFLI
jgi:hypothetical protein